MSTVIRNTVHSLKVWGKVYSLFFQDALVYRANAVIWLLTDTVPAVLMPLIWLASYNGRSNIAGFTPSQMVVYYMIILFLSCVVESHILWDVQQEIKDGRFNVNLIRPFSYMSYWYAGNLSWRFMRTLIFIPLVTLVLLMFHRWIHWHGGDYNFSWQFWLAVVLGHILSFGMSYSMGLLALTFVEVRSIFNFYYLPMIIFNGQIAPLAFLPRPIQEIALWMPFNYTLGFPAQVFIGQVPGGDYWRGIVMQLFWLAAFMGISRALWHSGLRRYTAYGI